MASNMASNMVTADWSHDDVDGNGVSLPHMASSTDLFDGDLFGDELIDIYNSSVAECEDEDDGSHGK
jgi:hypothetical protein